MRATETRLYFASVRPLEDEALFARLLQTVPERRQEKVAALRNQAARRLSLGAGLLLNAALSDAGLSAPELRETERGKPYFPALPAFHFSLSHSGAHVLCAVSPTPVGCDLEEPRRVDPELASRFFHPDESAWLLSLPPSARGDAFLRLWTCKESFMKALGLGFSLPLGDFAVRPGDPPTLTQAADPRPWRLRSFREEGCFCALCCLGDAEAAELVRVSLGPEVRM